MSSTVGANADVIPGLPQGEPGIREHDAGRVCRGLVSVTRETVVFIDSGSSLRFGRHDGTGQRP